MNPFRLARLIALEAFGSDTLMREPEPSLVMDSAQSVAAFDQQEALLLPLYHFSALAISRLLREGGRLLDLGSGSGRLLAHIARGRPDATIVGLELSKPMVDAGNRLFQETGLYPRVRLEIGDMTNFVHGGIGDVDVVSTNLALEHLPDFSAFETLVAQLGQLVTRGCGFWALNHSRPKTRAAAQLFPEVFTPHAPAAFREDSCNSLIASWRYSEMMPVLTRALGDRVHGRLSRLLPLYQVFWVDPVPPPSGAALWRGNARPAATAGQQFSMFRALYFPDVPLDKPA